MAALPIPAGVAAITSDWLTGVLRPSIGPAGRVASFESTRIGEGVGFLGELARVSPRYDGPVAEGAPASVIVKLPTQVPEPRGMAALLGFYEREVGFYRDLAGEVGVRIPTCYHADFEPADSDFALVLEDVQGASTGDQMASCSLDQAKLAVRELARLHARWWQSPRLSSYSWLPSAGHPFYQVLKMGHLQNLSVFNDQFAGQFDPMITRCANALGERYDDYLDGLFDRPLTLAHSDFRLDNMMFGAPGSPEEFVLLDWQLCQQSVGALDLQYFISSNLKKDVIERHTEDLLAVYYEQLRGAGVSNYSWSELQEDYARTSLMLGFYLVTGMASLSPEAYNDRGNALIETLFGTLADSMLRYEAERFIPA